VLYFDIDGTFLDYEDEPKTALLNGQLEAALEAANFDFIACVSGWSDIFADPVMQLNFAERKLAMYHKLEPLFPDKQWFMDKIILIQNTDYRCQYINFKADWYYIDDWADKFFQEVHGAELYQQELGKRILLCDHKGDGSDVLEWLISSTNNH